MTEHDVGIRAEREVPAPLRIAAAWSWRPLVVIALVAVAAWALSRVLLVVLPLVAAVLLATALGPAAARLRARGWRRPLASLVVFAGSVLTLLGVLAGLALLTIRDSEDLGAEVGGGLDDVEDWLVTGPLGVERSTVRGVRSDVGDAVSLHGDAAVGGATAAVQLLGGIILALVLLFFLIRDDPEIWRWPVAHAPRDRREDADALGRRVWSTLGRWFRAMALAACWTRRSRPWCSFSWTPRWSGRSPP